MLQEKEKQILRGKKAQLVQGSAGTRRTTELRPRDRNAMSASPHRRKWQSEGSGRWLHEQGPGLLHQILSFIKKIKSDVWEHTIINAWNRQSYLSTDKCIFCAGKTCKKYWFLLKLWKCTITNWTVTSWNYQFSVSTITVPIWGLYSMWC